MKNEPTQLEQYQKERITALTNEVNRLNGELLEIQETLRKTALKITVSDANFLKPLSEVETDYEIVNACSHKYQRINLETNEATCLTCGMEIN